VHGIDTKCISVCGTILIAERRNALRLSDLQYLMHQLGPATPEIVTIVQDDIDSWQVEFDEGVSLQVGWQEKPPRMLMTCSIGQPEVAARERVYASLLSANFLLTGTTNLKLALSQPDEDVLLIGEYELSQVSVAALQDHLSIFLQSAARFSTIVADAGEEPLQSLDRLSVNLHEQRA
jgi:hypothetical protein